MSDHDPATALPLGGRLKQLRGEHGSSQADLAAKIGTDAGQISRYENGRMSPSAEAVVRLAEILDVSTDYLLIDTSPDGHSTPPRTPSASTSTTSPNSPPTSSPSYAASSTDSSPKADYAPSPADSADRPATIEAGTFSPSRAIMSSERGGENPLLTSSGWALPRSASLHLVPTETTVDPSDMINDFGPRFLRSFGASACQGPTSRRRCPPLHRVRDGHVEPRRHQPGDVDIRSRSLMRNRIHHARTGGQPPRRTHERTRCDRQLPAPAPQPRRSQTNPERDRPGEAPNRVIAGHDGALRDDPVLARLRQESTGEGATTHGLSKPPRRTSLRVVSVRASLSGPAHGQRGRPNGDPRPPEKARVSSWISDLAKGKPIASGKPPSRRKRRLHRNRAWDSVRFSMPARPRCSWPRPKTKRERQVGTQPPHQKRIPRWWSCTSPCQ